MKTTRTYSIDDKLYDKFDKICKSKNLNRSQFLEDTIKAFVAKELVLDNTKFYKLIHVNDENYLTIKNREDNFVVMSNGNRIDIFDFEKLYEDIDPMVKFVVDDLNNNHFSLEDVKEIDPEDFLNKKTINPDLVKSVVEKIDVEKLDFDNTNGYKNGEDILNETENTHNRDYEKISRVTSKINNMEKENVKLEEDRINKLLKIIGYDGEYKIIIKKTDTENYAFANDDEVKKILFFIKKLTTSNGNGLLLNKNDKEYIKSFYEVKTYFESLALRNKKLFEEIDSIK